MGRGCELPSISIARAGVVRSCAEAGESSAQPARDSRRGRENVRLPRADVDDVERFPDFDDAPPRLEIRVPIPGRTIEAGQSISSAGG
jgi:hypothetical protein